MVDLGVKRKNGCCPDCGLGRAPEPSRAGGRIVPSWACASCSGMPRRRSGARAGGNPVGTGLCPRYLPPGVAPLRAVPDHDAEGCGRDPADADRVITRVRHFGVDEISYCKGRKFATLVYDLDRARVLWVGRGKGRDTIDRFFNDWLSRGQKARVAWASCDMSPAYIGAITDHCRHVTLVIDRFHLEALNQAVERISSTGRPVDTGFPGPSIPGPPTHPRTGLARVEQQPASPRHGPAADREP